jgi:CheY-like chemotaxis protein
MRSEVTVPFQRQGSDPGPILVVDGDLDVAESLALRLESLGYAVFVAYDGPSAIATALTYLPFLVLIDLSISGTSGFDLAQQFVAQPALSDATLVAMSDTNSLKQFERALPAGCVRHLLKSATIDELTEMIGLIRHGRGAP